MANGRRLGALLALVAATVAVAYGGYLLLVGVNVTLFTPDGATSVTREPSIAGLVPLVIGLVAAGAVASHRLVGYRLAAGLALVASLAMLFSMFLQLAAISTLLIAAAVIRALANPDARKR